MLVPNPLCLVIQNPSCKQLLRLNRNLAFCWGFLFAEVGRKSSFLCEDFCNVGWRLMNIGDGKRCVYTRPATAQPNSPK
jgi:hypothetical protein